MSKNFVLRAAVGMVALMCVTVVLEGQANAGRGKLFGGRNRGGCCAEEASCGCAAEPSCGCAAVVEEPSCGCAAEPSCGCASDDCSGGRKHRLFGGRRHRGGNGCESSCGAPAECGCGAPSSAPADGAVPPAPEAPAA